MQPDRSSAFRCRVQAGADNGQIKIRGRKREVRVLELSRDEFVVEANDLQLPAYKPGTKARVWFSGECWDVLVGDVEENNDGRHKVVLRRTRDRTPPPKLETQRWGRVRLNTLNSDPTLPAAIVVAFLVGCCALPGIGDSLGTAPKIRSTIMQIYQSWRN